MAKITLKNATTALIEHRGNLTAAAEAIGCTRQGLRLFINKNPELEEVRADALDTILDIGERHIFDAVRNGGDMKTVRWFMERKGKDRGYVTRHEETGKDGGPIELGGIERRVVDSGGKDDQDDD